MKPRTPRQIEVQTYHGERFMLQGSLANLHRIAINTGFLEEFKTFEALAWAKLKAKFNIKSA